MHIYIYTVYERMVSKLIVNKVNSEFFMQGINIFTV